LAIKELMNFSRAMDCCQSSRCYDHKEVHR